MKFFQCKERFAVPVFKEKKRMWMIQKDMEYIQPGSIWAEDTEFLDQIPFGHVRLAGMTDHHGKWLTISEFELIKHFERLREGAE